MAELTPAAAHAVIGVFLSAYNERCGSKFMMEVAEPEDDLSCDYLRQDEIEPGAQLELQLTRAVDLQIGDTHPMITLEAEPLSQLPAPPRYSCSRRCGYLSSSSTYRANLGLRGHRS